MKVVILAGGLGTRLAEETDLRPKPMVHIGGQPILWHILSYYAAFGYDDFIVACGYKAEYIKEYFCNFRYRTSDLALDLGTGKVEVLCDRSPNWKVRLIDTGLSTQTGGRVKRLAAALGSETFMLTYGDGLSNVNLDALLRFHRKHGKLATLTAVRPPARFGGLAFRDDRIVEFSEKSQIGEGWINGGFMMLEPKALDYIDGDNSVLERGPLEQLARDGELMAFRHEGFWQPMDTLREKQMLERLWQKGNAPWMAWK